MQCLDSKELGKKYPRVFLAGKNAPSLEFNFIFFRSLVDIKGALKSPFPTQYISPASQAFYDTAPM
jgi:hypothetical protein